MSDISIPQFRIASEDEVTSRRRLTLQQLGLRWRDSDANPTPMADAAVDPQLIAYLRFIKQHPGLPATKRDLLCGYKGKAAGHRLRARLKQLHFIEEYQVNPGGLGSSFTDVRLTASGERALQKSENAAETEWSCLKTKKASLTGRN